MTDISESDSSIMESMASKCLAARPWPSARRCPAKTWRSTFLLPSAPPSPWTPGTKLQRLKGPRRRPAPLQCQTQGGIPEKETQAEQECGYIATSEKRLRQHIGTKHGKLLLVNQQHSSLTSPERLRETVSYSEALINLSPIIRPQCLPLLKLPIFRYQEWWSSKEPYIDLNGDLHDC